MFGYSQFYFSQTICCGYSKGLSQQDVLFLSTQMFVYSQFYFNQTICCGYSKELTQWDSSFEYPKELSQWDSSFEYPKHAFKLMVKKKFQFLHFFIFYLGSAVAQWYSAWLKTEGPRVRASQGSRSCGPWARHIYPSLVLLQSRKTRPCLTERLLIARKESVQTKKNKHKTTF